MASDASRKSKRDSTNEEHTPSLVKALQHNLEFPDDKSKDISDLVIQEVMDEIVDIDLPPDGLEDLESLNPQDDWQRPEGIVDEVAEAAPSTPKVNEESTQQIAVASSTQKFEVSQAVGQRLYQNEISSPAPIAFSTLGQAEHLRIAQQRITDLEKEIHRLRVENEELLRAGDTLRSRNEDLRASNESLDKNRKEILESSQAESLLLKEALRDKDAVNKELSDKIEELRISIDSDLKKIRVRERELENRLELLRMEHSAVIANKDDSILSLKRKLDQSEGEINNYREKCQDLFRQLQANQEQSRRTIRALRLALTNLEVNDESKVSNGGSGRGTLG